MPTFRFAKLVRDNIPGWHVEAGHTVTGCRLEGEGLLIALIDKLREEVDEVAMASSREELIEELGDVQQIIYDLCLMQAVSEDELLASVAAKSARKGGFANGEYIESVTILDEQDRWAQYCRRAPDKYPEIK